MLPKDAVVDNVGASVGPCGVATHDPLLSPISTAPPSVLNISSFSPKSPPSLHSEISLLVCRCALIHEDSAEGGENDMEGDTEMTTISQAHSDSELNADEEASELGELGCLRNFGNLLEIPSSSRGAPKQMVPGGNASRPLVSVRSSPQLLNEICEEAEHDDEEEHASRSEIPHQVAHHSRRNSTEMPRRRDRIHRVHHRTIGVMVPRVASCSSSDASDTDDVEQRSHKQKQKHKLAAGGPGNGAGLYNLARRDSSEHSSDNDNLPSGWPCGGGSGDGTTCDSSHGCSRGNCKDEKGHGRENSGGGKQMTEQQFSDCETSNQASDLPRRRLNGALSKVHVQDISLMTQNFDEDQHIPETDCFLAPSSLSGGGGFDAYKNNNRLSNIIRFHSMEFSNSGIEPGKAKLKGMVRMRCHSTIDVGCGGTRAIAAALLAKLSCIDILERRSHSVSCLRARKVSM